jgi:hypothetical protein
MKLIFLIAIAIVLANGAAGANLLTNGSFELPGVPAGSFQQFSSGSTSIPGWKVTGPAGRGVAVMSGTYTVDGDSLPAEDGNQWLDLTGNNSNDIEGISQTVSTTKGQTYTLTFWVGNASGAGLGAYSSVGLFINGAPVENYTNSTPGKTAVWES